MGGHGSATRTTTFIAASDGPARKRLASIVHRRANACRVCHHRLLLSAVVVVSDECCMDLQTLADWVVGSKCRGVRCIGYIGARHARHGSRVSQHLPRWKGTERCSKFSNTLLGGVLVFFCFLFSIFYFLFSFFFFFSTFLFLFSLFSFSPFPSSFSFFFFRPSLSLFSVFLFPFSPHFPTFLTSLFFFPPHFAHARPTANLAPYMPGYSPTSAERQTALVCNLA